MYDERSKFFPIVRSRWQRSLCSSRDKTSFAGWNSGESLISREFRLNRLSNSSLFAFSRGNYGVGWLRAGKLSRGSLGHDRSILSNYAYNNVNSGLVKRNILVDELIEIWRDTWATIDRENSPMQDYLSCGIKLVKWNFLTVRPLFCTRKASFLVKENERETEYTANVYNCNDSGAIIKLSM